MLKECSHHSRQNHIEAMQTQDLDLLIIGGGVNGVWCALDARLRGLKVALVEKEDFGHGPSRNNSELLHGGFRYLKEWYQNPKNWLKFRSVLHLVQDALQEREVMMQIAPHLARPVPFCMPLFAPAGLGWAKRSFYGLGFWMYDLLSGAKTIKKFSLLNRNETIEKLPGIRNENLVGSGIYYDCKMEPGRLIAEIIKHAHNEGALLANYVEVQSAEKEGETSKIKSLTCLDHVNQKQIVLRAKKYVDATGPWGDKFRHQIFPQAPRTLRLSKGIHIMTQQLFNEAIACAFFSDDDNRIIFIIPWGEGYKFSLIGTTDTDYKGDPDDIAPDQKSIDYLTEKVHQLFPNKKLVCHGNYAGIRPLIYQEAGSASSVSREHQILDYNQSGMTSVFGGKWTTARVVAAEVLDHVFPETIGPSTTKPLRFGGLGTAALIDENGRPKADEPLISLAKKVGVSNETLDHLIFNYGRNSEIVLGIANENSKYREPILSGMPFIKAEIVFAVQFEMAMRVSDFLIRRSIFGRLRQRGLDASTVVAEVMGELLNWSADQKQKECKRYDEATQIVENIPSQKTQQKASA